MEQWEAIRRRVYVGGESKRKILRETGMHWSTLEKILNHSKPPGYKKNELRKKPKIGPFIERIKRIIQEDKKVSKKQRHTAKRIYERIKEEGYTGGYSVVKDAVREIKRTSREVFVPLMHRPGEAQVDYFEALVKMNGNLRKVKIFLMALPYSDAFHMSCYERECTESFQEGHARAIEFFEGVPRRISYDNSRIAVKAITGAHDRKLTDGFLELKSHYLFESHFCTVRRANEKGVVEGTGKYARLNFMVPVPQVKNFNELNEYLEHRCTGDMNRKLRGKSATKKELLQEEKVAFLPLPVGRFDASRKVTTRANSLSLIRFDKNDYSVPVEYAHHEVVVKGYVDKVRIYCVEKLVAEHARIWDKEKYAYNYLHYLPLFERKPGALDHALPMKELKLPDCFEILRRRLENEKGAEGTREYIKILRFLESHSMKKLSKAVTKALVVRSATSDVVKLYLYPEESPETATFSLAGREHLKGIVVALPDLSEYKQLMAKVVPA